MKNKIEVEKTIIVTKENFQESLKQFKEMLNKSKLVDYIILNNDISTSNPKIQDKEGEIVFSEFTFHKNVNYQSKDILYTFTTFLIPSIKLHRYSVDEIASFNSTFLKYLANEKSVYDFNLISSVNSLSYDNIHKRNEFEKSLNLILKDGKPFKKENKTSYNYYPKAFELPSIKYQKKFEEFLKYFVEQNFDENAKKIENEDKITFLYESDKYISDFKFLNNFLDFKWGQFFEKIEADAYKIFVNEYKINFLNNDQKFGPSFLKFVENVKNFFENEKTIDEFELEISQDEENELNEEFFKDWKKYIMAEEYVAEFSFEYTEKNKIKFSLKADKAKEKKDKFISLIKFLAFILSVNDKINNKTEFEIKQIFFRRINMKNLFPEKIRNNIEFNYHIIARIDKERFKLEKKRDNYLSKISYKKLFMNNENEEEILFGYKFGLILKQFLEVKDLKKAEEELNKPKSKSISLEFGKDLQILIKNEEFKQILDGYFSKFSLSEENENNMQFRTVKFTMKKVPNFQDKNCKADLNSLIAKAKEVRKRNLLDEEIGVAYFYDEIFKKEDINIYGTNLKNKIYFPIKKLLLEPNKNNDEEVKKVLDKVNIYDISYICLKKDIDFFKKYLKFKNGDDLKERTMTQRLGYVIEETDVLKNRDELDEFKNKFYFDIKDKTIKRHFISVDKNKLHQKTENIVKIFQSKTDFTISKNTHDNNLFEFNIIDPTKFTEIENITKEVEAC